MDALKTSLFPLQIIPKNRLNFMHNQHRRWIGRIEGTSVLCNLESGAHLDQLQQKAPAALRMKDWN